jgi:hypothetical protein
MFTPVVPAEGEMHPATATARTAAITAPMNRILVFICSGGICRPDLMAFRGLLTIAGGCGMNPVNGRSAAITSLHLSQEPFSPPDETGSWESP